MKRDSKVLAALLFLILSNVTKVEWMAWVYILSGGVIILSCSDAPNRMAKLISRRKIRKNPCDP